MSQNDGDLQGRQYQPTEPQAIPDGGSGYSSRPNVARSQCELPDDITLPDLQTQWLDPLSALDFSNFAQAGSSDAAMSFGFL